MSMILYFNYYLLLYSQSITIEFNRNVFHVIIELLLINLKGKQQKYQVQ